MNALKRDMRVVDNHVSHCSHAIVSSSVGPEYYVTIMSFVDKTQIEPGCTVLLNNKVRACSQPYISITLPVSSWRGLYPKFDPVVLLDRNFRASEKMQLVPCSLLSNLL